MALQNKQYYDRSREIERRYIEHLRKKNDPAEWTFEQSDDLTDMRCHYDIKATSARKTLTIDVKIASERNERTGNYAVSQSCVDYWSRHDNSNHWFVFYGRSPERYVNIEAKKIIDGCLDGSIERRESNRGDGSYYWLVNPDKLI